MCVYVCSYYHSRMFQPNITQYKDVSCTMHSTLYVHVFALLGGRKIVCSCGSLTYLPLFPPPFLPLSFPPSLPSLPSLLPLSFLPSLFPPSSLFLSFSPCSLYLPLLFPIPLSTPPSSLFPSLPPSSLPFLIPLSSLPPSFILQSDGLGNTVRVEAAVINEGPSTIPNATLTIFLPGRMDAFYLYPTVSTLCFCSCGCVV